jgi:hypothetical protein
MNGWMKEWMTTGARARSIDEFPRRVPSTRSHARVVSSLPLAHLVVEEVTRRRGHPSSVPVPCARVVALAPRSRPRLARSLDGRVVTAYATFAHAKSASATHAVVLPGGRRRDRTYPSAIARRVASSSAASRSVVTRAWSLDEGRGRRARSSGARARARARARGRGGRRARTMTTTTVGVRENGRGRTDVKTTTWAVRTRAGRLGPKGVERANGRDVVGRGRRRG